MAVHQEPAYSQNGRLTDHDIEMAQPAHSRIAGDVAGWAFYFLMRSNPNPIWKIR